MLPWPMDQASTAHRHPSREGFPDWGRRPNAQHEAPMSVAPAVAAGEGRLSRNDHDQRRRRGPGLQGFPEGIPGRGRTRLRAVRQSLAAEDPAGRVRRARSVGPDPGYDQPGAGTAGLRTILVCAEAPLEATALVSAFGERPALAGRSPPTAPFWTPTDVPAPAGAGGRAFYLRTARGQDRGDARDRAGHSEEAPVDGRQALALLGLARRAR